jgi:hypothetical protein
VCRNLVLYILQLEQIIMSDGNGKGIAIAVALIGAAGVIIAALIPILSQQNVFGSPTGVTTTATNVITTQTTDTQYPIPQPTSQETHGAPQPTPQKSHTVDLAGATSKMDSFCNYVNSGAIQQAYNLTSSNYQSQYDVGQFTNRFSYSDLLNGGCVHNQATLSGNNAVVTLTMNRININDGSTSSTTYAVTLLQDSQSGFWVIDSIQPQ